MSRYERNEENTLIEFLKRLAVIVLIVGAAGVSGNSNAGGVSGREAARLLADNLPVARE